jgi:hypothetical protein
LRIAIRPQSNASNYQHIALIRVARLDILAVPRLLVIVRSCMVRSRTPSIARTSIFKARGINEHFGIRASPQEMIRCVYQAESDIVFRRVTI